MLDVFVNTLDYNKFTATNSIWNKLGLNHPDNVGMVSTLINEQKFTNKEEWENYYYTHGRTKEYLNNVGLLLYNAIKDTIDISIDECIECVRFRVICETWNGIIIREENTIKTLDIISDGIFLFKKVSGNDDFKYAVDREMYLKKTNLLICGIQIKPVSYDNNNEYLNKAKSANKEKNFKYFIDKHVPVITILSNQNGSIQYNDGQKKFNEFYHKFM